MLLFTLDKICVCWEVKVTHSFFLKVPRSGGEPEIFWIFVYFLSLKQCLRPLGYCAPHKLPIL